MIIHHYCSENQSEHFSYLRGPLFRHASRDAHRRAALDNSQPKRSVRATWKSGGDLEREAFDTKKLGGHLNGLYLNGTGVLEECRQVPSG